MFDLLIPVVVTVREETRYRYVLQAIFHSVKCGYYDDSFLIMNQQILQYFELANCTFLFICYVKF